jgi:hypothetical protein
MAHAQNKLIWLFILFAVLLAACSAGVSDTVPAGENPDPVADSAFAATAVAQPTHPPLDPTYAAQILEMRSPDVPDLPFPDNPDPAQCGIPIEWGQDDPAYLSGIYAGELVQPTVLLYDSHLRFNITAQAPHGTAVQVLLYQQNPTTDYYLVKITGADQPNEGWVPAPFLSFEPVDS